MEDAEALKAERLRIKNIISEAVYRLSNTTWRVDNVVIEEAADRILQPPQSQSTPVSPDAPFPLYPIESIELDRYSAKDDPPLWRYRPVTREASATWKYTNDVERAAEIASWRGWEIEPIETEPLVKSIKDTFPLESIPGELRRLAARDDDLMRLLKEAEEREDLLVERIAAAEARLDSLEAGHSWMSVEAQRVARRARPLAEDRHQGFSDPLG